MNAQLPIFLPCLPLFVAYLIGFQLPTSQKASSEKTEPSPTAQPVALDTFEVLEVRGKVRATLVNANPRLQEGWFAVCQGDHLDPCAVVHVPFRGRLKVCKRPADPPVVLLLETGTLTELEDFWAKGAQCDRELVISIGSTRHRSPVTYDIQALYPMRCPVHRIPMKEDTVPVQQGLIVYSHLWEVAEKAVRKIWFPYSNRIYQSGVCFDLNGSAVVRYCSRCRKAEERWRTWGGEQTCSKPAP